MADVSRDLIQRVQWSLDSSARIETGLGEIIERLGRFSLCSTTGDGPISSSKHSLNTVEAGVDVVDARSSGLPRFRQFWLSALA